MSTFIIISGFLLWVRKQLSMIEKALKKKRTLNE